MRKPIAGLVLAATMIGCSDGDPETSPRTTTTTVARSTTSRPPTTSTTSTTLPPTTTSTTPPTTDVPPLPETYYATCAEAPGPVLAGEPGYRPALDRDGDGIACDDQALPAPPDEGDYLVCLQALIVDSPLDPMPAECEALD